MILLFCVGIPLLGAFLLPFITSSRLRSAAALAMTAAALTLAAAVTALVLTGNPPSLGLELPLGLSFGFRADPLSCFMALTSCLVALVIVVYSLGYMKHGQRLGEYYLMVVFFVGSMLGLVFSTNLIQIYLFWEFSSLCCWRLIGFYRDELSVKRANKAFLITVFGALVMFLGFLGVYGATGSFALDAARGAHIPTWAVACILVGILSKSATFPFHSWLPDAGVAPAPVTALLHAAVLVKIGVYIYARLFVVNYRIDEVFTLAVPVIAAVSALVSAGCALAATDIKRVVAYSTVSQLAYILAGLACGNETGLVGGMLYIMTHSVAKAGLFLCCGIIEHGVHTKDMNKMGGLIRTMPRTAAVFALCAFSVMGFPPFGGFFAKHMVIEGIYEAGHPLLAALFILGAVLTVLYLLRFFVKVFLGPPANPQAHEGSPAMVGSALTLAALALALGFVIFWPAQLAQMIWGMV